jgi:hypothetical protein
MHFGENQLSRSLIGLSPLPTTHPLSLQPKWVRASTRSYPRFTLAMGRSLRFGSRTHHYTPHKWGYALFRLAFAAATPPGLTSRHVPDSQAHSSKGTPSPHPKGRALTACRHTVSGTLSLPSRGTFHHSLTVLSAIGHQEVFRLTGWSRPIHSRFHEPAATRVSVTTDEVFSSTGFSPSTTDHPRPLRLTPHFLTAAPHGGEKNTDPTTPHTQPPPGITCARFSHPPLSLATTDGITLVFCSYGY